MPYARPSKMQDNGGIVLESHFSSTEPSIYGSSTQNDDRDQPQTPGMSWQTNENGAPWQHHVSTSFAELSRQFQVASQVVATMPPSSDRVMPSLYERLDIIEEGQKRLGAEIQSLQEQFSALRESCQSPAPAPAPAPPAANGSTAALEESLKEQLELFKLEQERLPGRLQNALATKSLSPIKILPMKNRKSPTNFPATRGEFEHLTRERYEALMASYDVPVSGDTAAKREALRGFLGIPAIPLEKK